MDEGKSLSYWQRLSERQRRSIIREARSGKCPALPELTQAACAWATWVIEQNAVTAPRRRLQRGLAWLALGMEMSTGAAGIVASPGIYSGEPGYEVLPVVRRAAAAVRDACCKALRSPGNGHLTLLAGEPQPSRPHMTT